MEIGDAIRLSGDILWMLAWTISIGAVASFLVFLAWRRPKRRWLPARIVATGMALASVLVIGLQPSWKSETSKDLEALLVTEGASNEALRFIADSIGSALPVYSLIDPSFLAELFSDVTHVPDPAALNRMAPGTYRYLVAGHGLMPYEWEMLPTIEVTQFLPPTHEGLAVVRWPAETVLGVPWSVSGRFSSGASGTLSLIGPDGSVDSLSLDNQQRFTLQSTPKDAGRLEYTLCYEAEGEGHSFTEVIGLSVVQPPLFSVLILESAPGFETRYLRTWLGEQGNSVAVRSQVSQDRFRTDVVNMPSTVNPGNITPELLAQFDVLITDSKSLEGISARARANILRSVREEGLGLLIDPAAAFTEASSWNRDEQRFFGGFNIRPTHTTAATISPQWDNKPGSISYPLPTTSFSMSPPESASVLISDESASPVVGSLQKGSGKVGVSLLTETYRWIIQGRTGMYASLWTRILSGLARPDTGDAWMWSREAPQHVHQPLAIRLTTPLPNPTVTILQEERDSFASPLLQNPFIRSQWATTFWAEEAGWHGLASSADTTWMYVYPDTAWTSVQHYTRTLSTLKHKQQRPYSTQANSPTISVRHRPISLLPFYLVFLGSCVFLWVEHKF